MTPSLPISSASSPIPVVTGTLSLNSFASLSLLSTALLSHVHHHRLNLFSHLNINANELPRLLNPLQHRNRPFLHSLFRGHLRRLNGNSSPIRMPSRTGKPNFSLSYIAQGDVDAHSMCTPGLIAQICQSGAFLCLSGITTGCAGATVDLGR
ncbi:hypothetical protein CPB84DRAFT_1467076 [Gymnopilus junonius]|uniref:Uncharacterized protein n=1 Tax=Gymnopilus junonius TaxID=109634 RepID=A0A9P5N842_GYMJU|nr:hypothetical protein CPB84DRAFT_1467076 [Gymnopilus junonius]